MNTKELELRYEAYKNFIEMLHGNEVVELLNRNVKMNMNNYSTSYH